MIDDVLVDVLRRTGKMSRADLVKALNIKSKHPDRQLRNIKERVNLGTGRFANTLIVGFSDRKGLQARRHRGGANALYNRDQPSADVITGAAQQSVEDERGDSKCELGTVNI
ncbi:MAG: hypothetical protein U0M88_01125 [Faecalicoccus sp.]|uniref:hypothetical protein n=1 Tax=Faecalicoccus sp. TaxID=1971758 RepID=UPI002F93DDC8